MNTRYALIFAPLLALSACVEGQDAGQTEEEVTSLPGYRTQFFALEAPATINVEGVGQVNIEEDYIPGVVACENGGAPLEALKAQAVQARSFLYYKIFVAGQTTIRNSTADQVYSCSYRPNGPDEIHRRAARETKGQYLEWNGNIVAAFYVAGAIPPNPDPANAIESCKPNGGNDPTSTQRWVTYNWGKTGCGIDMTPLGWVPSDCNRNPHNRGCASQNGEACLARVGWKYQDMLDYYYGSDIVLTNATGTHGGPPPRELTDYDRFCGLKADGSYCFDANVRVDCAEEFGAGSEVCGGGCQDGACVAVEEPGDETCGELADGAHCADAATRIECTGGTLSLSENCPGGCETGVCLEPGNNTPEIPSNNQNPNNPENPEVPNNPDPTTPAEFPSLVSTSNGNVQSCATGGGPASLILTLLGVLMVRVRRKA